jgi:hypothetical protein
VAHWRAQYDAVPARALIEDEANYEHLLYGSMRLEQAVASWKTRQSAWTSQMGGAVGFTYGGQGQWWACWNVSYVNGNCGPNGSPGYFTWYETLDAVRFPVGNVELPLMAALFRALPWPHLAPADDAIAWGAAAGSLAVAQRPAQKACGRVVADGRGGAGGCGRPGTTIVAYLPLTHPPGSCRAPPNATTRYGGIASGIDPSVAHSSWWVSPRTGEHIPIGDHPAGATSVSIPTNRPADASAAGDDWTWLLQPTADGAPVGRSARGAPPSPSPPPGHSWVRSLTAGGRLRAAAVTNGCNLTLGADAHVGALCRYRVNGSRNTVRLLLAEAAAGGTVLASATIDNRGAAADELGFVCGAVSATLAAGTPYVLAAENDGCDEWRDDVHTVVATRGRSVNSVYGSPAVGWTAGGGGDASCYGPMNMYLL